MEPKDDAMMVDEQESTVNSPEWVGIESGSGMVGNVQEKTIFVDKTKNEEKKEEEKVNNESNIYIPPRSN